MSGDLAAPFLAERRPRSTRNGAVVGGAAVDAGAAAEARRVAWALSQRPWVDDAAWAECVDVARVATLLEREERLFAELAATLRRAPLDGAVDVDAAVGLRAALVVDDAAAGPGPLRPMPAWTPRLRQAHGAGRRADPFLASLYEAAVLESVRRHVVALDGALCDLGGLHPSQRLRGVADGVAAFCESCARAVHQALVTSPPASAGGDDAGVRVALHRLRRAALDGHVQIVRRAVVQTTTTLVAVSQLAARAARADDADADDGGWLAESDVECVVALALDPPPDLAEALERAGAPLDELRWVADAPPAPWLAPSVATRAGVVRQYVAAHAPALASACASALHDARALLRRRTDDPAFASVGWERDAPARAQTAALPPLAHDPPPAPPPRVAALAAANEAPCGVRAARLLRALELECDAGLLQPRRASVRTLLPIVQRVAVELDARCKAHAAAADAAGVGPPLRADARRARRPAPTPVRGPSPAPRPGPVRALVSVPTPAPAGAPGPATGLAPEPVPGPAPAPTPVPGHLLRAWATLRALVLLVRPHAEAQLAVSFPHATFRINLDSIAGQMRAFCPALAAEGGGAAGLRRQAGADTRRALELAAAEAPADATQLDWHKAASIAGGRWTGVQLNGAGARALVACAVAHAELMERHPREAERRWARDASALYQLRYKMRKRDRGDGAQAG